MNDWKVIPTIVLTTVLIFGAGVFTGGMLVDYVKQNHPRMGVRRQNGNSTAPASPSTNGFSAQAKPVRPPEMLTKEFLQRLDNDLRLTKEEHEAVQKIIGDGQNQMRKVLQDVRLEMREALTTQAKRDQFDELVKRPFHKPIFATNAPPSAPATPISPATATNAP